MSNWSVVGVVVGAAVALVGLAVVAFLARRPDVVATPTEPAAPAAPAAPLQPATATVSPAAHGRRLVLQRGIIALFAAALAGLVASAVDYVWPSVTGTTGGRFKVGSPAEVRHRISAARGKPVFDQSGRFFVVEYPSADLPAARQVYAAPQLQAMELGLVALSRKCPHLGCAVEWCESSGWFECPCHGSRYNSVGELERGPAPRGLDRHPLRLVEGVVEVDTATVYLGPPPGIMTTDQPARGPHCY